MIITKDKNGSGVISVTDEFIILSKRPADMQASIAATIFGTFVGSFILGSDTWNYDEMFKKFYSILNIFAADLSRIKQISKHIAQKALADINLQLNRENFSIQVLGLAYKSDRGTQRGIGFTSPFEIIVEDSFSIFLDNHSIFHMSELYNKVIDFKNHTFSVNRDAEDIKLEPISTADGDFIKYEFVTKKLMVIDSSIPLVLEGLGIDLDVPELMFKQVGDILISEAVMMDMKEDVMFIKLGTKSESDSSLADVVVEYDGVYYWVDKIITTVPIEQGLLMARLKKQYATLEIPSNPTQLDAEQRENLASVVELAAKAQADFVGLNQKELMSNISDMNERAIIISTKPVSNYITVLANQTSSGSLPQDYLRFMKVMTILGDEVDVVEVNITTSALEIKRAVLENILSSRDVSSSFSLHLAKKSNYLSKDKGYRIHGTDSTTQIWNWESTAISLPDFSTLVGSEDAVPMLIANRRSFDDTLGSIVHHDSTKMTKERQIREVLPAGMGSIMKQSSIAIEDYKPIIIDEESLVLTADVNYLGDLIGRLRFDLKAIFDEVRANDVIQGRSRKWSLHIYPNSVMLVFYSKDEDNPEGRLGSLAGDAEVYSVAFFLTGIIGSIDIRIEKCIANYQHCFPISMVEDGRLNKGYLMSERVKPNSIFDDFIYLPTPKGHGGGQRVADESYYATGPFGTAPHLIIRIDSLVSDYVDSDLYIASEKLVDTALIEHTLNRSFVLSLGNVVCTFADLIQLFVQDSVFVKELFASQSEWLVNESHWVDLLNQVGSEGMQPSFIHELSPKVVDSLYAKFRDISAVYLNIAILSTIRASISNFSPRAIVAMMLLGASDAVPAGNQNNLFHKMNLPKEVWK